MLLSQFQTLSWIGPIEQIYIGYILEENKKRNKTKRNRYWMKPAEHKRVAYHVHYDIALYQFDVEVTNP